MNRSYHWVLTLEVPGVSRSTDQGTYTPPEGSTRQDAYLAIKTDVERRRPLLAGGLVVFFSLEPDQL
ncbi:hypothetical protein OHB04_02485 [Streptomyces sp. NBC_01775]|uniref:hypothetical protein n=1 Tax=Streptomyces sp. NBC_01775 TaxID=2975939 RepID=UPI002DDB1F39|nr:hypothetical protein [Streptomyces sp. NBC_01775]WSB74761.1 hypothetical protein OHB04_02485 [Streptomyces sp. NBC_01775]